jgi:heptosyltransferase-1
VNAVPDPPPRRVLVIRLSAIGDVIMSSGLIPVLRAGWPAAEIVWLTDEGNAALLRDNPRVTEVVALPRRRWAGLWREGRRRELWRELRGFTGALRERRFDLALDLQGLLKSAVWARLSGAPRRVGLGSREGSAVLVTRVVARDVRDERLGKEYRALAEALGLDAGRYSMDVVVSARDDASARATVAEAGVDPDYLVLAPFTTRPQKHWLDERWPMLARRLKLDLGLRSVLLGGPADAPRAAAVAARSAGDAVSLAGRTSLTEAAAVIRGASLLVGVDTGLTHLGIAMRTPTLALFGSTRPYLDPGVPRARVLYHAMDCSPCRRRPTCGGEYTCMRLHTVDNVAGAARGLLGEDA